NRSVRVPGALQSNQVGEIVAVMLAAQDAPDHIPTTIQSDSKYTIDGLTVHLRDWEDRGWIGIANSEFFKAAAFHLKRRSSQIGFQWVKGHNNTLGNERADQHAGLGARKITPDTIDTSIAEEYDLQGAKLSRITQSLAYLGIRERAPIPHRQGTLIRLDAARHALHTFSGSLESDSTLWASCRHPDIRATIQQFLFRALHRTQKIGEYWQPVLGFEHRAQCPACDNETETLEHILYDCDDPTASLIWRLAKDLWPHGNDKWPQNHLGIILACGKLSV
ncbi:ribonuclease H-like protein, partial [Artomyces pyxidatus]